jgi:hypothetical protein
MTDPFDDPRWKAIDRRLKELHAGSALDLQTHSGEIALLQAEQDRIELELGCDSPPRAGSHRWSGMP